MDLKCIWYTCNHFVKPGSDLCTMHHLKFGAKDLKVKKPISKVAEKRKILNKEYYKNQKIFLANPANKYCKAKMSDCTKLSQCVHHVRGRIGSKLLDENDWLATCLSCNMEIECKDAEAREKGLKKSKFKN